MSDIEQFTSRSNESDNNGDNSMRSLSTAIVISILIAAAVFAGFSAQ